MYFHMYDVCVFAAKESHLASRIIWLKESRGSKIESIFNFEFNYQMADGADMLRSVPFRSPHEGFFTLCVCQVVVVEYLKSGKFAYTL